jgi:hypothetical protein
MAHFAQIDDTNIVTQVIVIGDLDAPTEQAGIDFIKSIGLDGRWLQTSYNTHGGVNSREGGPGLRKNYATIDGNYDPIGDAFYAPQPFLSWILNKDTYLWDAPTPMPTDDKNYYWDEPTLTWVEILQA